MQKPSTDFKSRFLNAPVLMKRDISPLPRKNYEWVETNLYFPLKDFKQKLIDGFGRIYFIDTAPMGALTSPDPYPSVTTVLSATKSEDSKASLEGWKKSLGEDAERIQKNILDNGSNCHECCENFLRGELENMHWGQQAFRKIHPVLESHVNHIYAVEEFLDFFWLIATKNTGFISFSGLKSKNMKYSDINAITNSYSDYLAPFEEIEKNESMRIYRMGNSNSGHMRLAGRVDLVAEFDGQLSIIDFKTSKRKKQAFEIEEYFIQTALYAFMWNLNVMFSPSRTIKQLVIIMAVGDDSKEADVFIVSEKKINEYIKKGLERVQKYFDDIPYNLNIVWNEN